MEATEAAHGQIRRVYEREATLEEKIHAVATQIYGAEGVEFTPQARSDVEQLQSLGLDDVPVWLSKTPASLSDVPSKTGVPHGWELTVRELYPAAGAGFVVALTGDVLTMPGLPADPAATEVEVDDAGTLHGLF